MDKFNLNLEKDTLLFKSNHICKLIVHIILKQLLISGYCKFWTIVDNILITYDIIYDNIQVQIYCFLVAKISFSNIAL